MEAWQKDLLTTFAEEKLKETIEWLLNEWRGDWREISKLFSELYEDCSVSEWIGEEIFNIEFDAYFDEELDAIPEDYGYINEEGDWVAYPWGEDDV